LRYVVLEFGICPFCIFDNNDGRSSGLSFVRCEPSKVDNNWLVSIRKRPQNPAVFRQLVETRDCVEVASNVWLCYLVSGCVKPFAKVSRKNLELAPAICCMGGVFGYSCIGVSGGCTLCYLGCGLVCCCMLVDWCGWCTVSGLDFVNLIFVVSVWMCIIWFNLVCCFFVICFG